jgi:DNA-binding SARP family transcriptional activator/tetratricopeptide (TPR) repeat protein
VELWDDGKRHDLGTRKERCVLAVLLWELGRPITADAIIQRVWEADLSGKALSSFYSTVSRLRTRLHGIGPTDRDLLSRRSGSYQLDVSRDEVDVWRFRELRGYAKAAATSGDDEHAVALFGQAEALWHGIPLTGLDGNWAEGARATLNEQWLAAVQERIQAAFRLGRHAELVGEITDLVTGHPLNEDLVEFEMLALYRSGRRADALAAYRRLDRRWRDEFGGDPGPKLRDLHQRMLHDDPALSVPGSSGGAPYRVAVTDAVPSAALTSTMPRDNPDFTGRAVELDTLSDWLNSSEAQSAVPVAVISGMAGVGKTTLAVHAAHLRRDQYPDQLYLQLRGHSADEPTLDPVAALGTLLRRLGVPDAQVPVDIEDRAALWRSRLAGRRALILLDDAIGAEQVRPLLPGSPGCMVLITTRRAIDLPGMCWLSLEPMPLADAAALFSRTAGRGPIGDGAVASVLRMCGYLPQEIQLAGSELRRHPAWDVRDLAARLRQTRAKDRQVGAALALSYQYLTSTQQRLLRQLALHPGPVFSAYAAAAMAGDQTLSEAGHSLDVLLADHLVNEPASGRFAFHDLTREYAKELAMTIDSQQDRRRTMRRLLDYYLCLVDHADRAVYPFHRRVPVDGTAAVPDLPLLNTRGDYQEYLETEKANLLAIARHAASDDWPEHTALLAHALGKFLGTWGDWTDAIDLQHRAVAAWRVLGNTSGETIALTELSAILSRAGEHDEALSCTRDALAIAQAAADRPGEAAALDSMGLTLWRSASYSEALARHSEALTIWRELGDRHGEADALWHTAIALWHLGRYQDALWRAEHVRAAYRELGDPHGETNALNFLGGMQQDAECYDQALDSYQQALTMFKQLGDRQGEAVAFTNIGEIRQLNGHYAQALRDYRMALDILREIGDRRSEAETLNSMASTFLAAGDPATALTCYQQALILGGQLSERYLQASSHLGLGAVHLAIASPASAADDYRIALALSRQIGDSRLETDALHGLDHALAVRQSGEK